MYTAFQIFILFITFRCYNLKIVIGGLFYDNGNETGTIQEITFKYALNQVNKQLEEIGIEFVAETRRYNPDKNSSLVAEERVCELMSTGVAGIFGPQYGESHHIVQAICDLKEVPHIQTRWDPQQRISSCSVNLYPYPHAIAKAFPAIVQEWGWRSYLILYENSESFFRINPLLEHEFNSTINVKLRRIEFDKNLGYRPLLRQIKESEESNIIIDCSITILPEILKQAQQIGLMGSDHSFLITNLDFHTLDLEPYQYGGTNMTGIRFFDPKNVNDTVAEINEFLMNDPNRATNNVDLINAEAFPLEAALIYDAVHLYSEAVKAILDDGPEREISATECDSEVTWKHGYSIINFMRLSTFSGLTGEVKFDSQGYRTDFTVDIIELTEKGIIDVGKWNTYGGVLNEREYTYVDEDKLNSLKNKTFTMVIALNPPYGMRKPASNQLAGNNQYEGFCVDLIEEISKMNDNFTVKLIVDPDGKSGNLIPNTNPPRWNGMIGYIHRGEADLACADITINREREEAVDLTSPFMDLGIAILYHKPQSRSPGFFSFLSPFDTKVWILVITAYVSVSLLFFMMGRISPYEWRNPFPCIQDPDELENQFTLSNSFWFTIGALMQQGSEIAPVSVSTRMAAGVWWFFTLIMVSCYTANLAAFLTIESPIEDFTNIEELAQNTRNVKYGAKLEGTTLKFFNDSTNEIYRKMFEYMSDPANKVLTESTKDGVLRAAKPDSKYAFLMESSQIEYETERECSLTQVGKPIDNKGYGIAMKKGSWYLGLFSQSILKMQEDGRLSDLKRKWWKEKYAVSCPKEQPDEAETLGLANLGGVFIVLGGGVIVALIVAIFEQLFYVRSISKEEGVPMKERLKSELKFFFQCHGTTKHISKGEHESNGSGNIVY